MREDDEQPQPQQQSFEETTPMLGEARQRSAVASDAEDDTPTEPIDMPMFTPEQQAALASGVPEWAVGAPNSGNEEAPAEGEYEHWTVGNWAGIPNYICKYCPYATVDGEDVIEAHYDARHNAEVPQELTGLVDGNGNPITSSGFRG